MRSLPSLVVISRAIAVDEALADAGFSYGTISQFWTRETFSQLDGLTPFQAWSKGRFEDVEDLVYIKITERKERMKKMRLP